MTGQKTKVICAGLSCLDHIWHVERFPPTGSRTHASGYSAQGGGAAATAAVTIAKLSGEAELWALHGDDINGRVAQAELEEAGVDCSQLRTVPDAKTFVSAVLVDGSAETAGERHIFPYRGENLTDAAEGWNLDRVASAGCVLSDNRHPELNRAVLETARRNGVPTVGDWGNARHWELTSLVDHLIVSEECAAEVSSQDDPEVALASLRSFEDQLVGVTLGEQGFLFEQQGRVRHVPALHVNAVDTTGAGDVFHGAYAYGIAHGFDVEYSALFASVTAALSCMGVGRTAIPTADEVATLLEEKTAKEMDEMQWT